MIVKNNNDYAVSVWPEAEKKGQPFAGKLSPGATATVLDAKDNFVKVFVKNNTGWVDLDEVDEVKVTPPPTEEPLPESQLLYDKGYKIPDDGFQYVMAQHEIILFGKTRHSENQPTQRDPRPAVVNTKWGIKTLAKPNGDYVPIRDTWQQWCYRFWDWASGYRLPVGEKIGTHVNPKNPKIVYTDYTPGSKLSLYSGMIKDAKSHTDSLSPETGGRDVVTGRNVNSPKPWEWLCRPCTGALLRVESRNGSVLKIKAIDLNGNPPDVDSLKIWQVYYGTQVAVNGSVTRYPDVKVAFEAHGYPPAGTLMPLVAPGGYFYINKNACVTMKVGQIWTPYFVK